MVPHRSIDTHTNRSKRSHDLGRKGEAHVVSLLKDKGYLVLGRNYRIRGGEIDIIAKKDQDIFFVEVKTCSRNMIPLREKVDRTKILKIRRAAVNWMLRNSDYYGSDKKLLVVDLRYYGNHRFNVVNWVIVGV